MPFFLFRIWVIAIQLVCCIFFLLVWSVLCEIFRGLIKIRSNTAVLCSYWLSYRGRSGFKENHLQVIRHEYLTRETHLDRHIFRNFHSLIIHRISKRISQKVLTDLYLLFITDYIILLIITSKNEYIGLLATHLSILIFILKLYFAIY